MITMRLANLITGIKWNWVILNFSFKCIINSRNVKSYQERQISCLILTQHNINELLSKKKESTSLTSLLHPYTFVYVVWWVLWSSGLVCVCGGGGGGLCLSYICVVGSFPVVHVWFMCVHLPVYPIIIK